MALSTGSRGDNVGTFFTKPSICGFEEQLLSKRTLKTRKLKKILNAMGLVEEGGTRHDRMSLGNDSTARSSYGTTFIPRHGTVPMGTAQAIRKQVLRDRDSVQSELLQKRSEESSSSYSESSKQGTRKRRK